MGVKSLRPRPVSQPYQVQFQRQREAFYIPALFYIYVTLAVPYLIWRFSIINWHIWYGPLTFGFELFTIAMTATFLFITQKIYRPVFHAASRWPSVDIFITTYNEPLEVIEPTLAAAVQVKGYRSILLLDDGNRPAVKTLAARYGVRYYGRLTNEHAKAGNLNNGLRHSTAEFIMELDVDHIPLPNFLERTLGYFDDPKVAFVQTPQTYYNRDSFLFRHRGHQRGGRRWWSEQGMFYEVIQLAKNRWNASFFVGTSAVLRRAALDSIGGYATGTATEDIHTSLRLHAGGWKSVFVPEALAFGLEAANLKEFYKQRRRWAAGSLGLLLRSPDSPLRARGLKLSQRFNYLNATLAHLQGLQKLAFFALPTLCVLTLTGPVTINYANFNYIFIGFTAMSISFVAVYARGTYHLLYTEAYSLANMMAHFGGLKGVIKVQKKFAVSQKLVARAEKTWLKSVLWLLLAVGLGTVVRSGQLALQALSLHKGLALSVSSLLFDSLNVITLLSFMAYLLVYERRGSALPAGPAGHVVGNPHLATVFAETAPDSEYDEVRP